MNGAFENDVTRQVKQWAVYVAVLAVVVFGLPLFGGPSTVPSQQPVEQADTTAKSESPAARADTGFVKSSEGVSQRNAMRYLDRLSGAQSEPWTAPPAGHTVSPEVIQRQMRDADARPSVARVVFTPLGERVGNRLDVTVGHHKVSAELQPNVRMYLPLFPGVRQIELAVIDQGMIFASTKAKGLMPADALRTLGDQEIGIPLENSDRGRAVFRLHSEVVPKDVPANTLALATDPIRLDLNGGSIVYEGSVADMHYGHDLLIDTGERFTAILVLSDSKLIDIVRCFRLDTRTQIGQYAPELPLLAAMADNRAPLLIHVGGSQPRGFKYKVIAIARNEDPTLDLAVMYLGGHLMSSSVDQIPISDAQARKAVEWIVDAFGVRASPAAVNAITDVTARKIAESLPQATPRSPAQGSPK